MTEEQFKKGQEALYTIKEIESITEEVLMDEPFIRHKALTPFSIEAPVVKDIQNIIKEHDAAIKKEIITCLNAHLARLQHDFEMI